MPRIASTDSELPLDQFSHSGVIFKLGLGRAPRFEGHARVHFRFGDLHFRFAHKSEVSEDRLSNFVSSPPKFC